jgi:hypothetical protein
VRGARVTPARCAGVPPTDQIERQRRGPPVSRRECGLGRARRRPRVSVRVSAQVCVCLCASARVGVFGRLLPDWCPTADRMHVIPVTLTSRSVTPVTLHHSYSRGPTPPHKRAPIADVQGVFLAQVLSRLEPQDGQGRARAPRHQEDLQDDAHAYHARHAPVPVAATVAACAKTRPAACMQRDATRAPQARVSATATPARACDVRRDAGAG